MKLNKFFYMGVIILLASSVADVAEAKKKDKDKDKKKKKPKEETYSSNYNKPDQNENNHISQEELDLFFKYPMKKYEEYAGADGQLEKMEYGKLGKYASTSFNNADKDNNNYVDKQEFAQVLKDKLAKKYKNVHELKINI